MTKQWSESECEAALRRNAGIIALAAKDIGISRQGLHERVSKSEHLQRVRQEIDETNLDAAESVIMEAIVRKKDVATARWLAERKGKQRGYTTRAEVEGRLADDQIEALVLALGGDPEALRRLREEIGGPD